ncbi:hypothetical protein M8J77_014515 [Diaphorina citri]|nr:hypothetical protein M8J77_014515 [Diaphorina citri]
MYTELQSLKDSEKLDFPVTLTNKLGEILDELNSKLVQINSENEKNRQLTELLRKEVEKSVFFEEKYRKELSNIENLTKEWEDQDKEIKKKEDRYKEEILQLNDTIQKMKFKAQEDEQSEVVSRNTQEPLEVDTVVQAKDTISGKVPITIDIPNETSLQTELELAEAEADDSNISLMLEQARNQHKQGTSSHNDREAQEIQNVQDVYSMVTPDVQQEQQSSPLVSNQMNNVVEVDNSKLNLFVIGDSHVKELGFFFKNSMDPKNRVTCVTKPGQKLDFIIKSIKPDKIPHNSQICLIAGTNDLFRTPFETVKKSIDVLHKKCEKFRILVVLVPPRFDERGINNHIRKLNVKLKHCINDYPNFQLLDPHMFIRFKHFSNDYVHLNRKGKEVLCSKIITKLYGNVCKHVDRNSNMNNRSEPPKPSYVTRARPRPKTDKQFMKHKHFEPNRQSEHRQGGTSKVGAQSHSTGITPHHSAPHPDPSQTSSNPPVPPSYSLPCHSPINQPPWLSGLHSPNDAMSIPPSFTNYFPLYPPPTLNPMYPPPFINPWFSWFNTIRHSNLPCMNLTVPNQSSSYSLPTPIPPPIIPPQPPNHDSRQTRQNSVSSHSNDPISSNPTNHNHYSHFQPVISTTPSIPSHQSQMQPPSPYPPNIPSTASMHHTFAHNQNPSNPNISPPNPAYHISHEYTPAPGIQHITSYNIPTNSQSSNHTTLMNNCVHHNANLIPIIGGTSMNRGGLDFPPIDLEKTSR